MTRNEAVQSIYAWACTVRDRPKATCVMQFCAANVRNAIEGHETYAAAYDSLLEVLANWRSARANERRSSGHEASPDLAKAIDLVSMILEQAE